MTLVSQHTTCAWLRADPRLLNVETAIYQEYQHCWSRGHRRCWLGRRARVLGCLEVNAVGCPALSKKIDMTELKGQT